MNNAQNGLEKRILTWLSAFNIGDMDLKLVITAFTHPSYKGLDPHAEDYQRLEFLGDAVLDLITAEELVKKYKAEEGQLTEMRKQLVNNHKLSMIFDSWKIYPLIRAAKHYQPSIKDRADFIEAFLGAVFLEYGYQKCVEIWNILTKDISDFSRGGKKDNEVDENEIAGRNFKAIYDSLGLKPKNAKSMLQELCQKLGTDIPKYELVEKSGREHKPWFKVKVETVLFTKSKRKIYSATGEGSSKKLAEKNAAEKLCALIFLPFISETE